MGPSLQGVVTLEDELGRATERKSMSELAVQEGRGGIECAKGLAPLLVAAEDADEDAGVPQVGGDLDGHHRHQAADARVLDPAAEQLADLLAQELVEALSSSCHTLVGDKEGVEENVGRRPTWIGRGRPSRFVAPVSGLALSLPAVEPEDVALLEVVETFQGYPALVARLDLTHVFLESTQAVDAGIGQLLVGAEHLR